MRKDLLVRLAIPRGNAVPGAWNDERRFPFGNHWRAHKMLGMFERKLGRVNLPAPESLSAMSPSLPTWWIPESELGFAFVVLVFVLGAALAWAGKTASKLTSNQA